MEEGFIYRITCIKTGRKYIGQAREYKHKNEKPYRYGIDGRWSDHLSAAKMGSTKPLHIEIQQYGSSSFKREEITKATLSELDALEAVWIQRENTLIPHGYNVCKHSRNRHHITNSLATFYKGKVNEAILRPIRTNGKLNKVYVMLYCKDNTVERIAFGQKQTQEQTLDEVILEAKQFVAEIGCPSREETSNSNDPLERYASKITQFEDKTILKIRITSASSLVAVYITTSEAKSYKDQIRICFGGKTIVKKDAYELAKIFVQEIPINESTIIEDQYQCPQQAAALEGVTTPLEENSVIVSMGSIGHN